MFLRKSPCTGYCKVDDQTGKICLGCHRTMDEVVSWASYSSQKRLDVRRDLGRRRQVYAEIQGFGDQMTRKVNFKGPIHKIVSLAPSLTQTLYDIGLESKVSGVTAFCPVGDPLIPKIKVGGTKNVQLERIQGIRPDLILGIKEENTKDGIQSLEDLYPIWMADVDTLMESLEMIELLGDLLDASDLSSKYVSHIMAGLPRIQDKFQGDCAYLIWKKPYMVVGKATFINSWLTHLGFRNVFEDESRYPETSLEAIKERQPTVIMLPNEPYNFSEKEQQELRAMFPESKVIRVNGKHFTWHGTSMSKAIDYFDTALNQLC